MHLLLYTLQANEFKDWTSVPLRDFHPNLAEQFDQKNHFAISKWLYMQGHHSIAAMCMELHDPLNGRKIMNMTYRKLKEMDGKQEPKEPSFKTMVTACNSFHVCKKTWFILRQTCSF